MERIKSKAFGNSYIRQNIIVLGLEQPDCSPDGFYQPIFETESKYVSQTFSFLFGLLLKTKGGAGPDQDQTGNSPYYFLDFLFMKPFRKNPMRKHVKSCEILGISNFIE
jgi:hypothetical protein